MDHSHQLNGTFTEHVLGPYDYSNSCTKHHRSIRFLHRYRLVRFGISVNLLRVPAVLWTHRMCSSYLLWLSLWANQSSNSTPFTPQSGFSSSSLLCSKWDRWSAQQHQTQQHSLSDAQSPELAAPASSQEQSSSSFRRFHSIKGPCIKASLVPSSA